MLYCGTYVGCALQRDQEIEAASKVASQEPEPLQPYEQQRKENIARNERMLSQIQQGMHPGPQGTWEPLVSHKTLREEQERARSKGTQPSSPEAQKQASGEQGSGVALPGSSPSPVPPSAGQPPPVKAKSSSKVMAATEGNRTPQAPSQGADAPAGNADAPAGNAAQAAAGHDTSPADVCIRRRGSQETIPVLGSPEPVTATIDRKIQPHRTCKKPAHGRAIKHTAAQGSNASAAAGVKLGEQIADPDMPEPPLKGQLPAANTGCNKDKGLKRALKEMHKHPQQGSVRQPSRSSRQKMQGAA